MVLHILGVLLQRPGKLDVLHAASFSSLVCGAEEARDRKEKQTRMAAWPVQSTRVTGKFCFTRVQGLPEAVIGVSGRERRV